MPSYFFTQRGDLLMPVAGVDAFVAPFGGGGAPFGQQGNLTAQVSGAGISPGAINADNVLAVFSLPLNSFNAAGKGVAIAAQGSFANNTNSKRVKIIVNPATAVVGSTVGASGVTIADTGAFTTAALTAFDVEANLFKYGAAGSNTQIGINTNTQVGATTPAILAPTLVTAVESGAILIAITGNAVTTAADILLNLFTVNAMN